MLPNIVDKQALQTFWNGFKDTLHIHSNKSILDLVTAAFTTADKTKLDGIADGAQVNTILGVKGNAESKYRTGNINITPTQIGLGNVENKSSATIRGELTSVNVTKALGFTPVSNSGNKTVVSSSEPTQHIVGDTWLKPKL